MTDNALRVGDRLHTAAEYDRLPVGTVVGPTHSSNDSYTKQSDGLYLSKRYGTAVSVSDFEMDGYNSIKELGSGQPALDSLIQWQWRFRDNAYQSAEQAGVHRETVDKAMADLHLTDDMFPLGAGVKLASDRNKDLLPIGSVVVQGEPERLADFGVFTRTPQGWTPVLGQRASHAGYPVTVISGEPAVWATTPGTEAEQSLVKQFKAKAWKIGYQVKVQHRWCESYESYMARVGLDESVLREVSFNGVTVGDKVNAGQAAGLPEGTVLRWVSRTGSDNFTWYIRDDASRVVAKTRPLFGHRSDGSALRSSASSMEVLWIPDGSQMHLVLRYEDMEQVDGRLPAGTKIDAEDGTRFVVCGDHQVAVAGGRVVPQQGSWPVRAVSPPIIVREFGS